MFVGRRPDTSVPGVVVIQSGGGGPVSASRCRDLGSADSVLDVRRGRPVASQPGVYDGPCQPARYMITLWSVRRRRMGFEWVCPDAGWRCGVGDYEEQAWPPEGLSVGRPGRRCIAQASARHGIDGRASHRGKRRRGPRGSPGSGVWPISDALTEKLRETLAPVLVEVHPRPGPLPRRA